jgi:hypothetical protein
MEKITGALDIEGSLFFHLSIENNSKFLSSALSTNNTLLLPALTTQLSSSGGASSSQDKANSSVANNLFSSLRKDLLEVARSKDSSIWKKTSAFSGEKKDQILEKMSSSSTGSSQLEEAIETANELISELEDFMENEEQSSSETKKKKKDPVEEEDDDDDDDTKGKVHSIQQMFFASSKTNDFFAISYDSETRQR